MKKILLPLLTVAAVLFSQILQAQSCPEKNLQAAWASAKGYWVVKSNTHTPKEATISYYTNEHVLIGTEEVRNQRLKLHKKKTLVQLKTSLEEAVARHEKEKAQAEVLTYKPKQ
jgi:hypothetical protein